MHAIVNVVDLEVDVKSSLFIVGFDFVIGRFLLCLGAFIICLILKLELHLSSFL